MYSDNWIVKAKVSGEFCIIQTQHLNAEQILGLRRLKLYPEVDAQNQLTGAHAIEMELHIVPQDGSDLFESVLDFAKQAVAHIAIRIAIASGRRVDVSEDMSVMQFDISDPKLGRTIVPIKGAHMAPPTPIVADFVALLAKPSLERAMHWWSHSLRIDDPADSLHALFVALDLVAASSTPPTPRERRCKSCGFTEVLQPGLRDKIIYLLTTSGQLSQALAEEIYETRNALIHGGVAVSEEKKRIFRQHASQVRAVVRNEIALQMNCNLPPLPNFLPFDFHSSHLVLKFTTDQLNDGSAKI